MKKLDYCILFVVALVFFSLLATLQKVPGYMDAEYYYGQSIRFVQQHNLTEPFIWNFLNNPISVTGPGFAFWQPATSFIAAGGFFVSANTTFYAAKILFILMASCCSVMAAFFANLYLPARRTGWMAGLLTLFSGFYLPFITITDTFTPYMFFGGLFFVCCWLVEKQNIKLNSQIIGSITIGVLAGLLSLTRSDGSLWLIGGWLAIVLIIGFSRSSWKKALLNLAIVLLGFAIVMIPWYLRNYTIYHTFFPSGNGLMLWLTKYSDLFVYPSSSLTFSRWIGSGIGNILLDRLKALGINLQTLIASGGAIILAPMMIIGMWKKRELIHLKLAFFMIAAILTVMTILFPYAGERGGFFHSLSSVQVVLWALVPLGLDTIIQWGVKHRNWSTDRSWKMFGPTLIVVMALFSALIFENKMNKGVENNIPWNQTQASFKSIEQEVVKKTGDTTGVIMLNDPPGYSLVSNRQSVMIPTGDMDSILEVSKRYDVRYLALNGEREDIITIFDQKNLVNEHFTLLFEAAGTRVYEFKPK